MGEIFEFILSEWHLTPEWILDNWTDELFALMVEKLVGRKREESKVIKRKHRGNDIVSDKELFSRAKIKVVRRRSHGS